MIIVSATTAINAWMMQPVLDDIFINKSTLKLLSPLSSLYFLFTKIEVKEKITVCPSLKIPYYEKKSDRKTRSNKKILLNKSLKYVH